MKKPTGQPTIPDGNIDWAEATSILFMLIIAKTLLAYPETMSKGAGTAAWTVPFVSALLSIGWLYPSFILAKAYPRKNIVEVADRLAGRWLSIPFGLLLYVFIVGIMATAGYETTAAINLTVLHITPTGLLLCVGTAVVILVASRGIEVIGRLCLLFAIPFVISIALVILASASWWDWYEIFPIFGPGLMKLSKAYVVRQSMYGDLILSSFVLVYLRETQQVGRVYRWSVVSTLLTFVAVIWTSQMLFPYPALTEQAIPFLRVSRVVYLGRFFQRLDALFMLTWLSAASLRLAAGQYVAGQILAAIFKVPNYKPFLVFSALLTLGLSLLVPNFALAIIWDFNLIRPYSVPLLYVIPWTLLGLHHFNKKRGEAS